MKNNFKRICVFSLSIIILFLSIFSVFGSNDFTTTKNEIIKNKLSTTNSSNVQNFIDKDLSKNAGKTAEWYVLALCQSGKYNFSQYEKSLIAFLDNNKVSSATTRQKIALTLIGIGSESQYIQSFLNDSIGKQGIMSYIFGLHILNNGYKCDNITKAQVVEKILSMQKPDGGWAVIGEYSDVDVTAMAIQSLAPLYSNKNVKSSLDKALDFLSNVQLTSGGFISCGAHNAESSAQVLIALSSLNIDAKTDARFIKNNNTIIDDILTFQISSGAFSHLENGEKSESATVQVLCSAISYERMKSGKTPFYILDKIVLEAEETDNAKQETTTIKQNKTENKKETTTQNNVETAKNEDTTANEKITIESETYSDDNIKGHSKFSYKSVAFIIVLVLLLVYLSVLFATHKANKKNILLGVLIFALIVIFVGVTNFSTKDNFYNRNSQTIDTNEFVTVEIRCDTIVKKQENSPRNPVILSECKIPIKSGDTVYSALLSATAKSKIHLDANVNSNNIYVKGIQNIYEFDYGELSGWIYCVNGESPSVSCGEYKVQNGDKIVWHYTCNLGEDI